MTATSFHRPKPMVLVILDGFGERTDAKDNAILMASAPNIAQLNARFPHTLIGASGPDVGLPVGQMGNSEVGHLNFGAGRIAMMDLSRIDVAVAEKTLGSNAVIADVIARARMAHGAVHLLGLVSDGGVHSSLEHLLCLIDACATAGVVVKVHAFLDGRDTPPKSAEKYLTELSSHLEGKGSIATLSGRFYAMDRDQRWERVSLAYQTMVHATGSRFATWHEALSNAYEQGKTDEFVDPCVLGEYAGIADNTDTALFFNFRPDRAREITLALTADNFSFFDRKSRRRFAHYGCMSSYDPTFTLPVAYPKESYPDIFPEVIARAGLGQFRCAETEKYAHVTYFFNGGREQPYAGEERKLVPSPRDVATYDKKPEMSAMEITRNVVEAILSGRHDFILVNYANPDMVGHTGVLSAAIRAVETVDQCVGELTRAVLSVGGAMIVTADHGNCETMVDPVTGQAHTAHTLNPVPLWLVSKDEDGKGRVLRAGRICDVAPTMIQIMGLTQPAAMTGKSLILATCDVEQGLLPVHCALCFFEVSAVRSALKSIQAFHGCFEFGTCFRRIDIFGFNTAIGENGHCIWSHFGKARTYCNSECFTRCAIPHNTGTECCQQRTVARQDTELTMNTGSLNLIGLSGHHCARGCDHGEHEDTAAGNGCEFIGRHRGFGCLWSACKSGLGEFGGFTLGVVEVAHEIKSLFWKRIEVACQNFFEGRNGVGEFDKLTFKARELLCHEEGL
jgi:2,3-bisphosphoglycerate-independent phosphoglycerate mutase